MAWALLHNNFANFSSIIKLKDGNFLASGNLDDYPIAAKFDSNGDVIWTYSNLLFISFSYNSAFDKPNGEIVLVLDRKFITLDANDKEKSVNDITSPFFDSHVEKDTVYLAGTKGKMPYVESRTMNLDSISSLRLTENIDPNGSGIFNSATACVNGGFVTAGRARDKVNMIANTWNVKLAKFNGGTFVAPKDTTTKPTAVFGNVETIDVVLYPNPANNVLKVSASAIQELHIYNTLGKEFEFEMIENQINVAQFEQGLYFISATIDNAVVRESFMVLH
jgi:hypothetical protein